MSLNEKSFLRKNFHQSKWDEPVIFELNSEVDNNAISTPAEFTSHHSAYNLV